MRLPSGIQVYGIHDLRKKKKDRKEKETASVICVGGVRGKTHSQFSILPMCQEETLSIHIKYLAFIHYK